MSAAAARIGPGRLILVVGPSGAGKDSLIHAARGVLADDARYVFPRRTVTRPPSDAEDNEPMDEAAFERVAAADGFAVHWRAHGLRYGIPATIDDHIGDGRHVVCNVSRMVVAGLRARYADVRVIEITAPPTILAERLALRSRTEDGDVEQRLTRSRSVEPTHADITIVNASTLSEGSEAFLRAIRPDVEPRSQQLHPTRSQRGIGQVSDSR